MTEKVKVTQEQANWLARYETQEEIAYAIDIQPLKKRPDSPIVDWPASKVAQALYNDYEVDLEPEYKIGDWFTYPSQKVIGRLEADGFIHWSDGLLNELDYVKKLISSFDVHRSTAEEIKEELERRQWAAIGRSFRQIKEGDKYRVDCFERTIDGTNHSKGVLEECLNNGDVITFYPVESAIELGGESND